MILRLESRDAIRAEPYGAIPVMFDKIENVCPGSLRPYPRNARTHSSRQIAESIRRFGFTAPVLIDRANMILAGHGRVAAAEHLGLETVPCRRIETMTETEKRAYVVADNKLALNAGWDEEILAGELKGLLAEDLKFDIDVTGFSIAEIDGLVEGLALEEPGDPDDDILPGDGGPPRCRRGDLWQLGPHRPLIKHREFAMASGEMTRPEF